MEPFFPKHRGRSGPEGKIQSAIIRMLEEKGWFVTTIHGGAFQSGLPDLYATHPVYRMRWIEVKLPGMDGSHFTEAQLVTFPKLVKFGTPVFILTAATESEYSKLFDVALLGRGNFSQYLSMVFNRSRRA